ncbi:alpha/beta hydrolase [Roseateles cellulosilyticus]|uniref:Alpha/beta fold hydrolase n=1 Tax=Pelomonas cellulosilytica TaxID=2906762 RepID=A0ABS8XTY1_9BURK|nr:alpha/beta fold hydrolase [Pelomonas sp. P8]MCE4556142.1 alpha/beta fold hydrolase [Pelomonas sp. P8]
MNRLTLALATLTLGVAAASLLAGELLTRPARQAIGPPPDDLAGVEPVQLPDPLGQRISGWFVPGHPGEGAVLLLHGVRSNRLQMLDRARWLQREGLASLLIDLPSHGESTGERITFGRREAAAADAALTWLRARLPGERIGALGVSLGGATLTFAERQPELDALVLESVYPTIVDAVQDRLTTRLGPAGRWLAPLLLVQLPLRLDMNADQLRPLDAVGHIRAPLLIASGTEDRSTRWAETEQLFAMAPEPKTLWAVRGAGHVDLHAFRPTVYEATLGPWLHARLRKTPPAQGQEAAGKMPA